MVIVDSSVLIPLARVGRLDLLRKLYRRVRTTREVYRECVVEGAGRPGAEALRRAFEEWIDFTRSPSGARRLAASEGIAPADASLIGACSKEKEELLANDDRLLRVARAHGVRGRWLTSVVITATRRKLLDRTEARDLMTRLAGEGLWLSPEVFAAVIAAIDDVAENRGRR